MHPTDISARRHSKLYFVSADDAGGGISGKCVGGGVPPSCDAPEGAVVGGVPTGGDDCAVEERGMKESYVDKLAAIQVL